MSAIILNLTNDFRPLAGETIQFESFTFSGGEPHIKITAPEKKVELVHVTHRINSFNDLGLLCVAVDALQRLELSLGKLFIPYFPAARQDRIMVPGEPLSVKVYADIINALNFSKVVVFDVHSEVTAAVLGNCEIIPNYGFIDSVLKKIGESTILISPDGGALKKIYKLSTHFGGMDVVECSKSRDVKTGKLSGFKVYAEDLNQNTCLIVDDICDGGNTFIGLANELRQKNAGKLYLAVSHGIFSKGFQELLKSFENVFTTNSIRDWDEPGVERYDLIFQT